MPFSTRTMTDLDWYHIKYFMPGEFRRPGVMGFEFIQWLDQVREQAGVPMHITSSSRNDAENTAAGGATNSAHEDVPCNAVDIGKRPSTADPNWNHARFRIIRAALELGCTRIGMYPGGSLHLDRSEDRRPAPRLWIAV